MTCIVKSDWLNLVLSAQTKKPSNIADYKLLLQLRDTYPAIWLVEFAWEQKRPFKYPDYLLYSSHATYILQADWLNSILFLNDNFQLCRSILI